MILVRMNERAWLAAGMTDMRTVSLQPEVREAGCAAIVLLAGAVATKFETKLVRRDALCFGARPIDGSSPSTAELRPTTLQVQLYRQ